MEGKGESRLEIQLQNKTLWLGLKQLPWLFKRDKAVVYRPIKNTFKQGKLDQKPVVACFATTASDSKTYQADDFNPNVIIPAGGRVNAKRGTRFFVLPNQLNSNTLGNEPCNKPFTTKSVIEKHESHC